MGFLVATGDYGACYSKHTEHGVRVGMIQRRTANRESTNGQEGRDGHADMPKYEKVREND